VELALARIRTRVAQGGHDIPEHIARRRFAAGLENFRNIYRSLVNIWLLYDNSGQQPKLLDGTERVKSKLDLKHPDVITSLAALRRAARSAWKLAVQTNTPFYVWKDGRVVNLNPRGRLKRPPRPSFLP
jgi:hypothetical protein